jgi:hypothetical protein
MDEPKCTEFLGFVKPDISAVELPVAASPASPASPGIRPSALRGDYSLLISLGAKLTNALDGSGIKKRSSSP